MNVSDFFGKKVVSTAGETGYVISVNGGAGRVECLVCADADEREFYIDIKSVLSVGDKIVYEDRQRAMKSAKPLRLGRAGFDEKGTYLGEVEDYIFKGNKLIKAKIGKKSYPAEELTCGDVIIVKGRKRLKEDVVSGGKVILKKGTPVTGEVLEKARAVGEYIQTNLKSI